MAKIDLQEIEKLQLPIYHHRLLCRLIADTDFQEFILDEPTVHTLSTVCEIDSNFVLEIIHDLVNGWASPKGKVLDDLGDNKFVVKPLKEWGKKSERTKELLILKEVYNRCVDEHQFVNFKKIGKINTIERQKLSALLNYFKDVQVAAQAIEYTFEHIKNNQFWRSADFQFKSLATNGKIIEYWEHECQKRERLAIQPTRTNQDIENLARVLEEAVEPEYNPDAWQGLLAVAKR